MSLEQSPRKTENIPHSGEPVTQSPNFDNTTLEEAYNQKLIKTPESPAGLEKKSRKKLIIGLSAGAATLALAAGAAFGVNAMNQPPKSEAIPTAPADPIESAEPTTPDPIESEGPAVETPPKLEPLLGTISPEMVGYQEMSLDAFSSLPKNEQFTYWAEVFGGMDNIRDFATDHYTYSENEKDLLPTTISAENTPEEIMTVVGYGERLPFALSGEDRQKAAMTILEDDRGSQRWGTLEYALANTADGFTGSIVASREIVNIPDVVAAGDVVTDDVTGQISRELTISVDGQEVPVTTYFHTVDYRGQSFGWWTQQ